MVLKMFNYFKCRQYLLLQPADPFLNTAATIKTNNNTNAIVPITSAGFGCKWSHDQ